jgi:hypothetical protein
MATVNTLEGYNLSIPAGYQGPDEIHAMAIPPSGRAASLVTYNRGVQPSSTYPALPEPVATTSLCTQQSAFSLAVTGGRGGARISAGINTDEAVCMIRHAEAHPEGARDDGNLIAAGQWRALDLPAALQGKIDPTEVYSIDPAQFIGGSQNSAGNSSWSYVRPALTAEPYAIRNNLPRQLAAGFEIFSSGGPA